MIGEKIKNTLRDNITIIVLCFLVGSLFFGESSSNLATFSSGEYLYWLHARALLSISMIVYFLFIIIKSGITKAVRNFFYRSDLLIFSVILLMLVIAFLNSQNYEYIVQRIQVKLPFLIIPFCAASTIISRKGFNTILFAFILFTFLLCIYMLVNYIIYFDLINDMYLRSKVMPSPINHVRFSILIAIATYAAYYLFKSEIILFRFDKIIFLIIGGYLFLFIHLYSVRSGLIAIYAMVLAEILIHIIKYRSYRKAFYGFLLILISGVVMTLFFPTFKNKMINTRQDITVFQSKGNANNNSLSTRAVSYEIAIDLFKENIFWGCGLGDLEIKNTKLFKDKYPEIAIPIIPHNQFLYYLASMGSIGLFVFSFCFFFPLFYRKNYKNEFLLMMYIVFFLSFLTEPMIENQLGVACTVIFITLPLIKQSKEN